MNYRLPIRKLISYSVSLSIAITVFFFIMAYFHDLDFTSSLFRAIFAGVILLVTSALSIVLILLFEKYDKLDINKYIKLRFIIGVLINMIFMYGYGYIRETTTIKGLLTEQLHGFTQLKDFQLWQIFLLTFIPSILIFGLIYLLHNFILLQHFKTQTEIEVSLLRTANAETTNQLLRQQVQPHFLFNALSVLKTLISHDPQNAEAYLIRLSDFLRISFSKNKKGVASIKEELKICSDYLEMQKMRFGDALEYQFDVPEQYLDKTLPFFSLQMLAENAIKHNILTDESPLTIRISAKADVIVIENNLQLKTFVEDTTGYGLSNLSERYKLLSGNAIEINDDGKTFSVGFKII